MTPTFASPSLPITEPGKQRQKPIPTDLTLELVPMTYGDKAYVLRCQQNPFLRLKLGVAEPLRRYFDYVRHKWIPSDLRLVGRFTARSVLVFIDCV